jgi:hypothetical protein
MGFYRYFFLYKRKTVHETNWIKFISRLMMLNSAVKQTKKKSNSTLQRDENKMG